MNFPHWISDSGFERYNLVLCTATFDGPFTPEMQATLIKRTENFNESSPGGPLKARYFLDFQGNKIVFRQRSLNEAPTRHHFDDFRQEIGLVFADDTVSVPLTTQPAQPAQAIVPLGTK